jgi:hypothetical protein
MSQYDKIIIKSNLNNLEHPDIIIYKHVNGDRKMQFDNKNDIEQNVFQSSYNINDLDILICDI